MLDVLDIQSFSKIELEFKAKVFLADIVAYRGAERSSRVYCDGKVAYKK